MNNPRIWYSNEIFEFVRTGDDVGKPERFVELSALEAEREKVAELHRKLASYQNGTNPKTIIIDECHIIENVELKEKVRKLETVVKTAKNDYWFMINLLERYSTNKDEAIKDCIERMKFRKPMFEIEEA